MSIIKDKDLVAAKLAEIAEAYGRLTPDLVVQPTHFELSLMNKPGPFEMQISFQHQHLGLWWPCFS